MNFKNLNYLLVILLNFHNFCLAFKGKDKNLTMEPPLKVIKLDSTINETKVNYRLPTSIIPKHYDLLLFPKLIDGTFFGTVNIKVEVNSATNKIILHSKKLNITDVQVEQIKPDKNEVDIEKVELDTSLKEFLVISANKKLEENSTYLINIKFDGDMKNRIVGLYKSEYKNKNGQKKALSSTKFEPTYARLAFPCFDEPNMKAEFSVRLVRPNEENYIALSNMDVEEEKPYSETHTEVVFKKSVPMSTYLLGMIICDFDNTSGVIHTPKKYGGNDVSFKVFATSEQKNKTLLALETGIKVAEFYINYFQIPYPLPKLDLAAIPDFPSGALETWGLVTFRETALLYDPLKGAVHNKERVATVVAHELAHMWFGNLVTMDWWNDLWLNEGFATYIQYKGTNEIYPEWQILDDFCLDQLNVAMEFDGKVNSHPIVVPVTNPDEITAIFDTISYCKGSSIIRMLESFIGPKNFQNGITKYLKRFMYKNAVTDDLFQALQEVIDENGENKSMPKIKEIMDTWTRQMGYPVIKVEKSKEGTNTFIVTQKHFLIDPDANKSSMPTSEYNYKWTIPITFKTDQGYNQQNIIWFHNNESKISIKLNTNTKWLKLNHFQEGYYRVNYEEDMWNQLLDNFKDFDNLDKINLIEDAFNLAKAGQLKYQIPLKIAEAFYKTKETNFGPWDSLESKLSFVYNKLHNTNSHDKFKNFVKKIVKPIYKNLTWEVDEQKFVERKIRKTILSLACKYEVEDCLNKTNELFKLSFTDSSRLHPDIKSIVYQYGMKNVGTAEYWDKMWKLFLNETDAQEKDKLMLGLISIEDQNILLKLIENLWNTKYVRRQDYFLYLDKISDNKQATELVWNYVRKNWPKMVEEFGLNDRSLGRIIPSITTLFKTQEKLDELKEFIDKYPEAGAGASGRKRAVENIQTSIKWLKNYKNDIDEFLDSLN